MPKSPQWRTAIPATLEVEVLEAGAEEMVELLEEGQKAGEEDVVMTEIRRDEQTVRMTKCRASSKTAG